MNTKYSETKSQIPEISFFLKKLIFYFFNTKMLSSDINQNLNMCANFWILNISNLNPNRAEEAALFANVHETRPNV